MERPVSQRKPYPMPEGISPNRRYANVLMDLYSGRDSELTAITQYMYHHIELSFAHPQTAKTLRGIAVMEMYHLEMLGECIHMLGMEPKFLYQHGNRRGYWNSGFITYRSGNAQEMLKADKLGEQRAVNQYERAIQKIDEPSIRKLLERIMEDEWEHIRILESLIEALKE